MVAVRLREKRYDALMGGRIRALSLAVAGYNLELCFISRLMITRPGWLQGYWLSSVNSWQAGRAPKLPSRFVGYARSDASAVTSLVVPAVRKPLLPSSDQKPLGFGAECARE